MRNKVNLGIHVSCLNVVIIIVSLFSSCAGETNIIDGNNNKLLSFSVSVPSWKSNDSISSSKDSRATPITETSLGTSNTFNLIADENDGSGNYSTLIDNKPVSYSNNLWKTKTDYYWSGTSSKTINFYAYYSTSAINGILNHTAGSAPTLTYTVPDDVTSQIDIIAAISNSVPGNTTSPAPLTFNHIFSAVKFNVGASGLPSGTIKSISISGIHNSGTYTFGGGWSNVTGSNTFVISPSTVITGASGVSITSDTYTLMMIPQVFTNATITLTYNTGTSYKQTISGTWTANNISTYNLSKPVNIGDYYYSDGTWGSISENPQKVPIAIIFSNITSEKDKKYGFTHGYAMALNNANAPNCWSLSQGSSDNMTIESSNLQTDYDGYDHFLHIFNNKGALIYSATNYPAFYNARNYNVVAPSNSSGWYLPSVGQWFLFISNIGKSSDVTYDFDNQTGSYNIYWTNCTSISSIIESVAKNTNSDTFVGYWYWCSSEQNSNYGSLTNISSNSVYTGGADPHKGRTPDDSEKLRSVIAF